ncbi:MAG: hypothetical protein LH679_13990, partial [Cyanobacteria bacterium CAN_BIN43]|nr:hypothetical protein [Cyanobacteria bacterium CAN_BIN43]
VKGHEGKKLRVYRLDDVHWQIMSGIVERRRVKRSLLNQPTVEGLEGLLTAGSPGCITIQDQAGDPKAELPKRSPEIESWLTLEVLEDVQQMWQSSVTPEEMDWIRANVPFEVLERAIA